MRNCCVAALVAAVAMLLLPVTATCEGEISVRLENGFRLEFRPARSAAGPTETSAPSGVVFVNKKNVVSRLIADVGHRRYFGYRITVSAAPGREEADLAFGPLLDDLDASEAVLEAVCPGCRLKTALQEGRVGGPVAFPAPQAFRPGESFFLDLMTSTSTGETLVDVVTISKATGLTPERSMLRLRDARLTVDGRMLANTASCEGFVVYFALQGHGRFLVSPRTREGFAIVGIVRNNVLTFASDERRYEWVSSVPIIDPASLDNGKVTQVLTTVWVRHEPGWAAGLDPPRGTYVAGAEDETRFRPVD